jgi:endonuclease YncB( thermonuclease family)
LWRGLLCVALAIAFHPALGASATEPCPADHIDAWAEVRGVLDGDTLLLADGRKVRLLGINAPEVGHEDRPAEPFATAARRALEQLAAPPGRVGLRYEQERQDHYGRTLAHVFLPDGTNVQRSLLEQGLAASIVVPPNGWAWECYRASELEARRPGRGLWGDARFRPTDPTRLGATARGFWLVSGRVQRVGESRNAWWLNLAGGLALRIDKDDLPRFGGLVPKTLRGRQVEARGWVNEGPRDRWVGVRHPAALTLLD